MLPDLYVMADRELPSQGKEIKTILKVSQTEKDKRSMISLVRGLLREKYNQLVNVTTQKAGLQMQRTNKWLPVGGGRGGTGRAGDEEVQTTGYKISCKDILSNMGNIANIL